MDKIRKTLNNTRGFTLIELSLAMVVFAVIGVGIYGVMVRTIQAERVGSSMAEAQQNARAALDIILRDLREAGYGDFQSNLLPVERASDYRATIVIDRDSDGVIEAGERITYFMDNNADDPIVAQTPNPDDYVLRRVVSDATDLLALPASGKGQVIAYGITQRTPGHQGWNVPLFTFTDLDGTSLASGATDVNGSQYGYTLADSTLGIGVVGNASQVRLVRVQVVAEASHKDPRSDKYRQVRVSGTVHPRNISLAGRGFFANATPITPPVAPPDTTGGLPDTTGTPEDTTVVQIPPVEDPIHLTSERILSLILRDIHEADSQEGSGVTEDHQHDWDILIGAKASNGKDLSVWYGGLPDRYSLGGIYNYQENWSGTSTYTILALASDNLDNGSDEFPDLVGGVEISDNTGGFQYWRNTGGDGEQGELSQSSVFYSNSSGRGQAIALADIDKDGDLDVVLGTRTGANSGKIEIWKNTPGSQGKGAIFVFVRSMIAAGEVNTLAIADFDDDGYADIAAGTRTTNSGNDGAIEIWLNKSRTGNAFDFQRSGTWTSGGQVLALAAGSMDDGGTVDLVAGTRTRKNAGEVELWLNNGTGKIVLGDEADADGEVLSLALGQIDYGNNSLDIVAGTKAKTVQVWFCDPAASPAAIVPTFESWSDANAGGQVTAVAIAKIEQTRDNPEKDLLNDIVVGTAVTEFSGEIVLYLNPYVWTLNP